MRSGPGKIIIFTEYRIRLDPFGPENYTTLISWIKDPEELMQFGGPLFTFPLTTEQLDISLSDKNRISFSVVLKESNISIGHSEIYLSENSAKIGRILIGDRIHRQKGIGREIVHLLLDYVFSNLDRNLVELNVFDWNIEAIKCYEKVGFKINPYKTLERRVNDKVWTALNMTIDKSNYNMTLSQSNS